MNVARPVFSLASGVGVECPEGARGSGSGCGRNSGGGVSKWRRGVGVGVGVVGTVAIRWL